VFRAFGFTGNRALGIEFGLRTNPAAHGYVGYAAMSCATLRAALELVIRYVHLRQRDLSLALSVEGETAVLAARDNFDLGALRHLIHEATMIGFFRMLGFLLGRPLAGAALHFDWPQPDYLRDELRARLPPLQFGAPQTELRFAAGELECSLMMADPVAVRRAVEQCEREMATSAPAAENLLERVRAELALTSNGYPDLESVASCLFMSSRTLKRKLAERGTRFQVLLDEIRYRDARRLLDNPDLDIQQIATTLGYEDPPSFTRAFRRWSGKTPSQARTKR
jgi:AraC-like DNA-binding protein